MIKRLLFYLLFFLTIFRINAQNTCASAVTISSLPFTSGTLTTCGSVNDYTSSSFCNTLYGGGEDYVFTYTATSSGSHPIALGGSGTYKIASVHSACPPTTGNCIGSITTSSGTTASGNITLTSGVTYYIIIDTWTPPSCGIFTLSLSAPIPPPSNDNCSNATSLTVNSDLACATTTNGTTSGATQSSETAPSCSATGIDDDVWYSFTAASTAHQVKITSASSTTAIAVYSGSCGALTQISGACTSTTSGTATLNLSGLTSGNNYYVRVYSTASSSTNSTFTLCVGTPPPPPSNDNCSGAISLTVNPDLNCTSITSGTTYYATQSQAACLSSGADDDVWFSFVATSTSHLIDLLNVSGSTDMLHQIFSGSCGSLSSLNCSDPNSSTTSGLTIGTTYYVRVHTYSTGNNATFDICVKTPPPPPSNDICTGAIEITETTTCTPQTFDTYGATDNNETGDCVTGTENSVWFKFTALTTSATVKVVGSSSFDAVIAALVNCGNSTRPTGGSCTDLYADGLSETMNLTGLTVGNIYYVQVHDYNGDVTSTSTFTICVYSSLLPLELTSINAKSINKSNKITWTTANEKNTAWHQIERANDELAEFKSIGKIAAAGNSLSSLDYSFMDENPLFMSYYRVRTIDLDGKESISPVVSVERAVDRFSIEKLYPNPTNNLLNIDIQSPESEEFTLNIFNSIGQVVYSKSVIISKGISTETFDVNNLSNGYYHLQLKNNIYNINHQFCKQ